MTGVVQRMSDALAALAAKWKGRRPPKAFYLAEDDYAAFMATDPPTVQVMWGNNPPMKVTEAAFENVPVRVSTSKRSRLYDYTGTGREIA